MLLAFLLALLIAVVHSQDMTLAFATSLGAATYTPSGFAAAAKTAVATYAFLPKMLVMVHNDLHGNLH